MTLLCHTQLTLTPLEPVAHTRQWSGVATRAWFLDIIRAASPDLFQQLTTENHPAAYTVSPLQQAARSQTDPVLTITSLDTALTDLWQTKVLPALSGATITIDEVPYSVAAETTLTVSDHDLIQQHTLGTDQPARSFTLRFRTPVTFHSGGTQFPLPTPDLVFGGLVDRWNALCDIKLHPDARIFARECIRIKRYRLESRRVDCGDSPFGVIIGGVGDCRYTVWRGDEYWRRLTHTLIGFSRFSGVGARTAIGLGQVEAAVNDRSI